ncbi:MAG TPA: hydrogenase nickel incorporation protein HypB [Solirubrobacteraceae bacterium]|nr:hydrogenase nickel incorporation protein HypB [Solirubrobacteraceae bacterium]
MHRTKVRVAADVLDANDTIARANRADFDEACVRVVNLMSAPGAGKTSLLERVLADGLLRAPGDGDHSTRTPGDADERPGAMADERPGAIRVGVLEGDVQGSLDAERIAALHVPVTQLNTARGFGGECHLDANMVRSALPALALGEMDLLVIENVGNLVCPAEFRVGEDARAMIASVTEGEDKPLKYPLMFRACELVVVNKLDLLAHVDFSVEDFLANLDRVNPGVAHMLVSARTGEGVGAFAEWLAGVARREPLPA